MGRPEHISEDQKSVIDNVKKIYEALEKVIKLFDDYPTIVSKAKFKAKHGGLKILNPKQMLQRLPILLAQVKAGNTSENLLNEIHQIIYYLYQAKKLLKKYITI